MPVSVSILTISRNHLAGLRRTIESVRSQDYFQLEHVIVDGASSDGTVEYLASNGAKAPNTVLISEPDEGISDAMNKAVALASGDIFLHINAGDRLADPHVIRKLAHSFETQGWRWAVGNLILDRKSYRLRKRILSFDERELLRSCYLPQPSTAFAADLAPIVSFDTRLRLAMDHDLFLRLACVHGIRPYILGFDVAEFEPAGASSAYWPGHFESARIRRKHLSAVEWLALEARFALRAGIGRISRSLLSRVIGLERAGTIVRDPEHRGAWYIESLSSGTR